MTTTDRQTDHTAEVWENKGVAVLAPHESTADTASGLNRKLQTALARPVYPALAAHQRTEPGWAFGTVAAELDRWFDRFSFAFGLALPRTALRLDPDLRRTCAGYFRAGHNEFGLAGEIALAVRVAVDGTPVDFGDQLGTLLHEMLHLEQALTGTPGKHNYHNVAFRRRAAEFGLVVDDRGYQGYAAEGRFHDLLTRHSVPMPRAFVLAHAVASGDTPPPAKPAGGDRRSASKLTKWRCGCTNVWVGVRELHARCIKPGCERPFARADAGQ